jgi:NAD(P)-dependent dehydrogenase (short-subunit alcohol dehydrogenase family)
MAEQVVLVTGASGGLGKAVVAAMQAEGWSVARVSRSLERLSPTTGSTLDIEADVSRPEGAASALAICREKLGPPAALAHCAGTTLLAPLHRTLPEQFRGCLVANLESAFFTLSAFVDAARQAKVSAAAAVLVSSVVARIGVANHEAIALAKAGVEGLVRSAAATYAGDGIRINAVAPGLMDTPAAASFLKTPSLREAAARQYPLGGVSDAADVAAAIAWLLGPAARRVSGQILPVDGGFTAIRPLVR